MLDLDALPIACANPLVLFTVKESFRAACKDALNSCYRDTADGRVSKVSELKDDWQEWSSHADVQALPFQEVISKATDAAAQMSTFQSQIDKWSVEIVVPSKTRQFRQIFQTLQDCNSEVCEYMPALEVLNQQSKGEVSIRKARGQE